MNLPYLIAHADSWNYATEVAHRRRSEPMCFGHKEGMNLPYSIAHGHMNVYSLTGETAAKAAHVLPT